MRTLRALLAVAALISGGAVPVAAQGTHVGFHAGLASAGLAVGLQAHVPIAGRVELYPSYDLIAAIGGAGHMGNLDFKITALTGSGYIGAGVTYSGSGQCANCEVWGGNVFFGFESRTAATHPHIELRLKPYHMGQNWYLGWMLSGGLNFELSSRPRLRARPGASAAPRARTLRLRARGAAATTPRSPPRTTAEWSPAPDS